MNLNSVGRLERRKVYYGMPLDLPGAPIVADSPTLERYLFLTNYCSFVIAIRSVAF